MKRFVGQVAVITGGNRGIGFGIAKRLGAEGAKIAIVDLNQSQTAEKELKESGIDVMYVKANVTDHSQVKEAISSVIGKFKQIDVLVTAAGITGKTGIKTHEVDPVDFATVMNVNVAGIFNMCKETLPHMLERNYGRIVNIASISGKDGNAGMLAYSTSKAGVIGLTKVIGKEYAETAITCNCIVPAVIKTDMVAAMPEAQVKYMTDKIPMKRTGTIEEISGLAAYVASQECSFTTAFAFDASGGRAVY
eukprot:TRINITY_DN3497_c0_g1_i1.p1 TRINITY_DN3497_c0_g1~~TRINITY_DN3497_c0_g1_i1.p1  ORF type:complete len:249 (+),score=87.62 TRINITY_DN3497_c0_g1_i1:47-793(+)